MAGIGSYEWSERTNGILSRRDEQRAARMFTAAQVGQTLSRWLRRSGFYDRRMRRLDLDRVPVPDTVAAKAAEQLTYQHYSQPLRFHCLRTYYFASLWSQFYRLRVDAEALYVASLLHDLGLAPNSRDAALTCCFAVVGARSAYEFAAEQGWPEARRRRVYEAISHHLNPYLFFFGHQPETICLHRAAHLDVVGTGRQLIPPALLAAVHEKYPRAGFRELILAAMADGKHAPGSVADWLVKVGFGKLAGRNPLDRVPSPPPGELLSAK